MEEYAAILHHLLEKLPPITLEEMSGIRLMNRTDCKYVTNVSTLAKLLELTQGSYYAQDRDGARICAYATTYWDTADGHDMFRTHHCGHSPRTKVRVRTYMDTQHTFLEVKRKNNHGKTSKKRVEVPSLQAVMDDRAGEEFLKERSGYTFDDLIPTLANRFQRITLVNYAKTERLTIDFDLHFFNHETGTEADMDSIVIIELKRDGRVSSPIVPLLRQLRVKPSGFSKYCIGSAVTNDRLRQNRFKKRLVRIRKVAAKNTEISNLESSTH